MLEAIGSFVVGVSFGILVIRIWFWRKPILTPEQIVKIMEPIVNQESVEEHRKLLKLRMARAGQHSIRDDSGPHAKIFRMRIGGRRW